MPAGVHVLLISLFPLALVAAAVRDASTYTIPNWLSAALALAFVPVAFALGLSPAAVGLSAAIGFAALVAGVAMFAAGWIGGGDAKLFAASAMWLGWPAVTSFLGWTGIAGGGLAILLLALRRSPISAVVRGPVWVGRLLEPKADVPYGVAIAVGALAAFPASSLFRAAVGV